MCKIAGLEINPDDSINSMLMKLKKLQQTPYMTENQKEVRRLLEEIILGIEKKDDVKRIEENIKKLEDAIDYDIYWD